MPARPHHFLLVREVRDSLQVYRAATETCYYKTRCFVITSPASRSSITCCSGTSEEVMRVISQQCDSGHEIQLALTDMLPPADKITAVFVFAFEGDQLLLTDLVARELDVPGGHVEAGETPEEALRREVYEVTGAHLGPVRMLGYNRRTVLGPESDDYPYPYPDSYLVAYMARITALNPFVPDGEARGRVFIVPSEVPFLPNMQGDNLHFYQAAMADTNSGVDTSS